MTRQNNTLPVFLLAAAAALSAGTSAAALSQSQPAPTKLPVLAILGPAELVWNQSSDRCPGYNKYGHVAEQPDSMPIAWHNPLTNVTSIIAANDWGTFASKAPSLEQARVPHDCSKRIYNSANLSTPWSYANHQWLQSAHVYPDGTGWALVHNEFHGEDENNSSYCSFNHSTADSRCQYWSTVLAKTVDGGDSWTPVHPNSPGSQDNLVFSLAQQFQKDQPLGGYGALSPVSCTPTTLSLGASSVQRTNNSSRMDVAAAGEACYGLVSRIDAESGVGLCAFRTTNLSDPRSFLRWNGTAWGASFVNPYSDTKESGDGHECASVVESSHASVRRLAPSAATVPSSSPSTFSGTWPEYVMVTWGAGAGFEYSFSNWSSHNSSAGGAGNNETGQPFTSWTDPVEVNITGWLDPHTLAGYGTFLYPSIIDVDSPRLETSHDGRPTAAALSYNLVGGNRTYIYFILGRRVWARVPVGFLDPDGPPAPSPAFPPLPPNPPLCPVLEVSGAGSPGVDGLYDLKNASFSSGRPLYQRRRQTATTGLEEQEQPMSMYCFAPSPSSQPTCQWHLAHLFTQPVIYLSERHQDALDTSVPPDGWVDATGAGVAPWPVVTCTTQSSSL